MEIFEILFLKKQKKEENCEGHHNFCFKHLQRALLPNPVFTSDSFRGVCLLYKAQGLKLRLFPLYMNQQNVSSTIFLGFCFTEESRRSNLQKFALLGLLSQSATFATFHWNVPQLSFIQTLTWQNRRLTDTAVTLSLCYFCSEMTLPCHLSAH